MDKFDPYHKWLGIPPAEQPPNHYRLLGVELFEDDPEVIKAAADIRMTFIQKMAIGPHLEHSQRLLNELAQARIMLNEPVRKVEYDKKIRLTGLTTKGNDSRINELQNRVEESLDRVRHESTTIKNEAGHPQSSSTKLPVHSQFRQMGRLSSLETITAP